MGLRDAAGTEVVRYTYDAWGKLLSTAGSLASTLGYMNPFRYRGYVYDEETGLYYLRSRYYNPTWERFVNVDLMVAAKKTPLSHNCFTYCSNNSLNKIDSFGTFPLSAIKQFLKQAVDTLKNALIEACRIKFDVPLYNQGSLLLCWAYSQTMVEDYKEGVIRSQEDADKRAKEIAIIKNGEENWNKGSWPTNTNPNDKHMLSENQGIFDLFSALVTYGPVYAYYGNGSGAHLVVITGVDLIEKRVYSNNPWGISGDQSYEQFLKEFAGMPDTRDLVFGFLLFPQ